MAERDGVRVRITLDRSPMPATEQTRITTEVRNVGSDAVRWMSDGCAMSVGIRAEMSGSAWRLGVEQQGVAKLFKDYAIHGSFRTEPLRPPVLEFVPPAKVGKGSSSCADIGIVHEIAPGETVTSVQVWDGFAARRWGPPPTGAVTITGTFDGFWRGDEDMPEDRSGKVAVRVDASVIGGAEQARLSPPEVADAALADPAFAAYLETRNLGNGSETVIWYRPSSSLWEVGVLVWSGATPKMHLVLIDPLSGAIVDTVDRDWDQDSDGFP